MRLNNVFLVFKFTLVLWGEKVSENIHSKSFFFLRLCCATIATLSSDFIYSQCSYLTVYWSTFYVNSWPIWNKERERDSDQSSNFSAKILLFFDCECMFVMFTISHDFEFVRFPISLHSIEITCTQFLTHIPFGCGDSFLYFYGIFIWQSFLFKPIFPFTYTLWYATGGEKNNIQLGYWAIAQRLCISSFFLSFV